MKLSFQSPGLQQLLNNQAGVVEATSAGPLAWREAAGSSVYAAQSCQGEMGNSTSSVSSMWLYLQPFLPGTPCQLLMESRNWSDEKVPLLLFSLLASLVSGSGRRLGWRRVMNWDHFSSIAERHLE